MKRFTHRSIVIYLAGKYSGDIAANIQIAREQSIRVWEAGFTALCPHLNTQHFETDCKCIYDDYINGDIELLKRCDAILMLPGWEESGGARNELKFAQLMGVPIFYSLEEMING